MRVALDLGRRPRRDRSRWASWFAWRPVVAESRSELRRVWVWLERVLRRYSGGQQRWLYRLPEEAA